MIGNEVKLQNKVKHLEHQLWMIQKQLELHQVALDPSLPYPLGIVEGVRVLCDMVRLTKAQEKLNEQ